MKIETTKIEYPNSDEFSPFYTAVENGNVKAVESYIRCGADVNQLSHGWSLLHRAIESGHKSIAAKLLDAGADPHYNCHDNQQHDLFEKAKAMNLHDVANLILAKRQEVNVSREAKTPAPRNVNTNMKPKTNAFDDLVERAAEGREGLFGK